MKTIKPGLKFKDPNKTEWKVYTKVSDRLWSCLPTKGQSQSFKDFSEAQIQEFSQQKG